MAVNLVVEGAQEVINEVARVPGAGGLVGWALNTALKQFVQFLGDVHRYPKHCRELIALLDDRSGRVPAVLNALDKLTDLPAFAAWRNDYHKMCDVLREVQLLLLSAPAELDEQEQSTAKSTAACAAKPSRTQQKTQCACLPMRRRAADARAMVVAAPKAPKARQLCERLRELCSLQQYNEYLLPQQLDRILTARAWRPHNFASQPPELHAPVSGAAAAPAALPPFEMVVQLYEQSLPHLKAMLLDAEGPVIVGIVGNGGTGKTTLAKAVYNAAKDSFEACHFMTAGRDVHVEAALKEAYASILGRECEAEDAGQALEHLVQQLRAKQTLLVLDDLWLADSSGSKLGMLDALNFATRAQHCHKASKVLVTTR